MPAPKTPHLTVDVIIELNDREHPDHPDVVLIERLNEPYGWALPGGFVDVGECAEDAAIREAKEETGLKVKLVTLLGAYSDPARDPRGHNVSLVYVGQAQGEPKGADDAGQAGVFDPIEPPELVFDHDLILADYRRYRTTGERTPLRPSRG